MLSFSNQRRCLPFPFVLCTSLLRTPQSSTLTAFVRSFHFCILLFSDGVQAKQNRLRCKKAKSNYWEWRRALDWTSQLISIWCPEGASSHAGPFYGLICIPTTSTVSQRAAKKETAVPAQADYGHNILTRAGRFIETRQMVLWLILLYFKC